MCLLSCCPTLPVACIAHDETKNECGWGSKQCMQQRWQSSRVMRRAATLSNARANTHNSSRRWRAAPRCCACCSGRGGAQRWAEAAAASSLSPLPGSACTLVVLCLIYCNERVPSAASLGWRLTTPIPKLSGTGWEVERGGKLGSSTDWSLHSGSAPHPCS